MSSKFSISSGSKPEPQPACAAWKCSVRRRLADSFSPDGAGTNGHEFILQYLSEPELRRRIRRGLLKVEQLHALARDVFYGRRGRINASELHEQMNSCSCLTLILACVIYWQAKEISRVLRMGIPEGEDI